MILDLLATLRPALAVISKKLTRAAILYLLFFLPKERKIAIERWVRGREQFKKLQRADFVIVSYGKSGRTWLRVMLSRFFQVRYGLSDKQLIGFDNLHFRNRAALGTTPNNTRPGFDLASRVSFRST